MGCKDANLFEEINDSSSNVAPVSQPPDPLFVPPSTATRPATPPPTQLHAQLHSAPPCPPPHSSLPLPTLPHPASLHVWPHRSTALILAPSPSSLATYWFYDGVLYPTLPCSSFFCYAPLHSIRHSSLPSLSAPQFLPHLIPLHITRLHPILLLLRRPSCHHRALLHTSTSQHSILSFALHYITLKDWPQRAVSGREDAFDFCQGTQPPGRRFPTHAGGC